MNESAAIALQYGFYRRSELDAEKYKFVAFVDIGHSKTTVFVAGFIQDSANIIFVKSDRNLGGRDLDYAIMKKIGAEFQS